MAAHATLNATISVSNMVLAGLADSSVDVIKTSLLEPKVPFLESKTIGAERELAEMEDDIEVESASKKRHRKSQFRRGRRQEPQEEEEYDEEEYEPAPRKRVHSKKMDEPVRKEKVATKEEKAQEVPPVQKMEAEPKKETLAAPQELAKADNKSENKTEDKASNITGHLKEAAMDAIDCAKECTAKCTEGKNLTVMEIIKCLKDCKCEKKAVGQLLQSINLFVERILSGETMKKNIDVDMAQGRSIGKLRWGTFFVIFFIVATIVSGVVAVYKRYNVVKSYQRNHRIMHQGDVIYQRLI